MAPAEHTQLHESPYDQVLAEIGKERWKNYKQNIVPVENKYFENVKWMGGPEASNMAAGLAKDQVRAQGDAQINGLSSNLITHGANPNSGAYKMHMADASNQMAASLADADASARGEQKNNYFRGLEGIVAMGNNQASESISSISDVADMGRRRAANNAEANALSDRAIGQSIGTAAGLGLGVYGRKYGGF